MIDGKQYFDHVLDDQNSKLKSDDVKKIILKRTDEFSANSIYLFPTFLVIPCLTGNLMP